MTIRTLTQRNKYIHKVFSTRNFNESNNLTNFVGSSLQLFREVRYDSGTVVSVDHTQCVQSTSFLVRTAACWLLGPCLHLIHVTVNFSFFWNKEVGYFSFNDRCYSYILEFVQAGFSTTFSYKECKVFGY